MFFNSNFSVMLRQSTQRLDVMLLATLATPQAVGFYHIARRSAEAAIRLGRPLAQAIYPELARFAAARDTGGLGRFLFGVSSVFVLLLALVVLPVLYWIEPLVVLAFGESFRNAAQVVSLQVAAAAVLLAGVGVVPAMLSLDRDVSLVLLRLVVTGLFFALFWPLATRFGAEGAAAAHLVCNMVWLFAAALILRTTLARRPGGTP
jgi:O-antigen/teichoic acid export membrane protein